MDKKRIFGSKISKKIATLLSVGAIALPITGCTSTLFPDNEQDLQSQIEIEDSRTPSMDASHINARHYYDGYVANFEKGNTSYIIDEMDSFVQLYETLSQVYSPSEFVGPSRDDLSDKRLTYNYDGSPLRYDYEEDGIFYLNDEAIKSITSSSVELKTLDGTITINHPYDKIFTIKNVNESNDVTTTINYNVDKSCKISDDSPEGHLEYQYDENGLLLSSRDTSGEFESRIIYTDGDVNKMRYGQTEKVVNPDGSYTITESDWLIRFDNEHTIAQLPKPCDITYYYNKDNTPKHASVSYESKYQDIKCTAYPDGRYILATKQRDKNGKLSTSTISEHDDASTLKEFIRSIDDNGVEHTRVETTDYSLLNANQVFIDSDRRMIGDTTYLKVDGVEYIKEKDGFIYHYNEITGDFMEAYQVIGNRLVNYADENGKIIRTRTKTKTTQYFDYDNNEIKSILNTGTKPFDVEFYDNKFTLNPQESLERFQTARTTLYNKDDSSYVYYYEDGRKEFVYPSANDMPPKIVVYDPEDKIIRVSENNEITEYYDYDRNLVKSYTRNGISYSYYEDSGNVSEVRNISSEEPFMYGMLELKPRSFVKLYENGSVQNYYYDATRYYEKDEDGNYIGSRAEDNTLYRYISPGKIGSITRNMDDPDNQEKTTYYDYDANLIRLYEDSEKAISYNYDVNPETGKQYVSSVTNKSENPLTVSDRDGNTYSLAQGDSIDYWENESIHYLKQGSMRYEYCLRNNTDLYFVTGDGNVRLYYDDQLLYESDNPRGSGLYIASFQEGDDTIYIGLANGTTFEVAKNKSEDLDEER